jgi:hypothetical protein
MNGIIQSAGALLILGAVAYGSRDKHWFREFGLYPLVAGAVILGVGVVMEKLS